MSGLVCHYCANPGREGLPLAWVDSSWPSLLVHNGRCRTDDLYHDVPEPAAECMHSGLTCDEFFEGQGCPAIAPGHAKCDQCFGAVLVDQLLAAERHAKAGGGGDLMPHGTATRGRWVRFGPAVFAGWDDLPEGTDGVILEGRAMCRDCADRHWPEDARRRKWRGASQAKGGDRPSGGDEALAAKLPTQGAGIAELTALWGKSERGVRDAVKRLCAAGLLTSTEAPTRVGGAARKTYFPTPVDAP